MYLMLAFDLWLASINLSRIEKFPPDAFYYAKQLSPLFWIGMIVLTSIMILLVTKDISKLKYKKMVHIILILIFTLYLFGTTCFLYNEPRFSDERGVARYAGQIIDSGFTISGKEYYLDEYPGAIIFLSICCMTSAIHPIDLAKYFSISLMFTLSILAYVLASKFSKKYSILAPLALLSFSNLQEYHMSPQALSLILYVTFWVVMIDILITDIDNQNSSKKMFVLIICFITLTVSHLGTPLVITIDILTYFVLSHILLFLCPGRFKLRTNIFQLIIIFLIIYFSWMIYISNGQFASLINIVTHSVNNVIVGNGEIIYNLPHPQLDYTIANNIQLLSVITQVVMGLLAVLILWVNQKKEISITLGCWFLGSLLFILYGFFYSKGFYRAIIFSLIPFSILMSTIFSLKLHNPFFCCRPSLYRLLNIFLISVIVLAAFSIPLTRNSVDAFEYLSDANKHGNIFESDKQIDTLNPMIFSNSKYNLFQLRESKGDYYKKSFNKIYLNQIYNDDDFKIYLYNHFKNP